MIKKQFLLIVILLLFSATSCSFFASPTDPIPWTGKYSKEWMNRHDQINERAQKGSIDILFIGDSITHFWETTGRSVWDKYYAHRNAANFGIFSDRTEQLLWRLTNENLDNIYPKIIVLLIGTNNTLFISAEGIKDGISEVLQVLRNRLSQSKIILMAILPRGKNPGTMIRRKIEKVNAMIQPLADNKQIYFFDLSDQLLTKDGHISKEVMYDYLHLTEAAYESWAKTMEPLLLRLLNSYEENIGRKTCTKQINTDANSAVLH